jgi:hypothetical protein
MRSKRVAIVVGAVIVAILVPVAVYSGIRRFEQAVFDHKAARDTTGVVIAKKHVQFDTNQASYLDDQGRRRTVDEWRKRDGEFRVFYTIDNFDQVPGKVRAPLVAAEEARFKRYGPRYEIANANEFERTAIGQRIKIVYRWASDSEIELIDVELNPPSATPSRE